ncbi:cholinesterase-like [Rhinatrema bivittatum]|uniref:cholinesterase-like n=1 Tax=Rhinatrema bivittatum TaxID=194408 RepID=UPI001127E617|nr:cholinesterase-like [Rhinatrema bivittatum]XP_029441049.1 cholinesterase-like [Rhinatrema bivittatum]
MMWNDRRKGLSHFNVGLLFLHACLSHSWALDETLVDTKQGKVRGLKLPALSESVTAFLGIPYGEPPTGALRFQKPEPRKAWDGILDATKYGHSCHQVADTTFPGFSGSEMWNANTELSEDCLYLNVWVPSPRPMAAAVMVWIHGGGFLSGTSSLDVYDGRYLTQAENVIVVTINYRLGPLGFLALPGCQGVHGNAGLFDQRLALLWVQENIAQFGGNPEGITIFGESAGGASVSFHVLSPKSHPFFTRAIIESGSANAKWAAVTQKEARTRTLALAKLLACPTTTDTEIITCLQTKDPQEITNHQFSLPLHGSFRFTHFLPTIDGDFLTDMPEKLLEMGQFKASEILAGIVKNEGTLFSVFWAAGFSPFNDSLITRAQYEENVKKLFTKAGELGVESVLFQYTDWEDEKDPKKNRDELGNLFGDESVLCPLVGMIQRFAERGLTTYLYRFDHRSSQLAWPEWMGVMHTGEIAFIFGSPLDGKQNYSEAEQELSRMVMRSWANFARSGDPNDKGDNEKKWPVYTSTEQEYLSIKADKLKKKEKLRARECRFWDSYFPLVLKLTGHAAGDE